MLWLLITPIGFFPIIVIFHHLFISFVAFFVQFAVNDSFMKILMGAKEIAKFKRRGQVLAGGV